MNRVQYKGYEPEQMYCEHPYPDIGPVWFVTEARWYAKRDLLDRLSMKARYIAPSQYRLERMLGWLDRCMAEGL